jgi:hypothetical protein
VAREIARLNGAEGIEATGDADALHAAQVFAAALEKNRQGLNSAGAFIGKLRGRIAMQAHDRLKVAGGFWREFRAGRAKGDWDGARLAGGLARGVPGVARLHPPEAGPAHLRGPRPGGPGPARPQALAARRGDRRCRRPRGAVPLPRVVEHRHRQTRGAGRGVDLGEFRPPPGKARAVSKHRVLHFAGPDAWMDYHARFGRGSLLRHHGRAGAGGEERRPDARWGPNPEAAFDNELARLAEVARARGDAGAAMGWARGMRGRVRRADRRDQPAGQPAPGDRRGDPAGPGAVQAGRHGAVGAVRPGAGGAGVQARPARPSWTATARPSRASRLQDAEEGKLAADLVDVGARSAAAHLAGRFTATDGPLGWGPWAQRVFYRVNGFEFVAEGLRRGWRNALGAPGPAGAARLGAEHRHARDAGAVRHRRGGLGPGARGAAKAEDGRTYLTFEHIAQISDAEAVAPCRPDQEAERTKVAAERVRDQLETRGRPW